MPSDFHFICKRQVRRIPSGWQHPRRDDGQYKPLPLDQMPPVIGKAELIAYETVSEGTPVSPAFPDTPEGKHALIGWCSRNLTTFGSSRGDGEIWRAILFGTPVVWMDRDGRVRST